MGSDQTEFALLTKVCEADDKAHIPMKFVNFHTGDHWIYLLRDTSLPCRIPHGADCLANLSAPGWTHSAE